MDHQFDESYPFVYIKHVWVEELQSHLEEWRGHALNIHAPFALASFGKAKTLACTKTIIPAATQAI